MELHSTAYGMDNTLSPIETPLKELMSNAINNLPSNIFENVEFSNNGWKNSESLHLTGDSKVIIPIAPFYSNQDHNPSALQGGGIL